MGTSNYGNQKIAHNHKLVRVKVESDWEHQTKI
jgi:hypothetical protein